MSSVEGLPGRVLTSDMPSNPHSDSASDNETSERPVREKLKKASIASMPKDSLGYSSSSVRADEDVEFRHANSSIKSELASSMGKTLDASANGCGGRAERNQSFEHLPLGGKYQIYACENEAERNTAPPRKIYIDVQSNNSKEKNPMKPMRQVAGAEHNDLSPDDNAATAPPPTLVPRIDSNILPLPQRDLDDFELGYALFGPRKKRSRDQLDADIDREQKIVATEEAKAQRRSEEQERDTLDATNDTAAEIRRNTAPSDSQCEESGPKIFSNSYTPGVSLGLNIFLWRLLTYSAAGSPFQ